MKKQRILVEKGVNAKVVFKGVVIEIKKVNEHESELIFPEFLNHEELIRYLQSVGIIKIKEVKVDESVKRNSGLNTVDKEQYVDPPEKEDNLHTEVAETSEDTTDITEEEKEEKQHVAPKKRKRKSQ
jgi:hypothetical protein